MEKMIIHLTIEERDMICAKTFADDRLIARLKRAEIQGNDIRTEFSLEEIDELLGYIAAEANHSKKRRLQKKLEELYEKISLVEDRYKE